MIPSIEKSRNLQAVVDTLTTMNVWVPKEEKEVEIA